MSYRIRCYTLFDITKTGIVNRKPPINGSAEQIKKWEQSRNTQSNFDTVIQIVSLRSQPEEISTPLAKKIELNKSSYFGFAFDTEEKKKSMWEVEFSILHHSVFNDELDELGFLYKDCHGVPMIKVGTEWNKLPLVLDTTPEFKNIHFEIIDEKETE
jgi:hypothetical protein